MNSPEATPLRVFVYDAIARRGTPPALREIGEHFEISPEEARVAVADAALGKTLLPDPSTGEIAIAGPVARTPTAFRVAAGGVTWFANSAWDLLGIPAMFTVPVEVETRCADCGEPLRFGVDPLAWPAIQERKPGTVDAAVVHFRVPPREWERDVAAAAASVDLFVNEQHLDRWVQAGRGARGATTGLEQAWQLAHAWYHDPRQPGWRPLTKAEQQQLVDRVGLRGPFWRL